MPTSQHFQISKIIDLIIKLNPHSILDIGVGFGKYGMLCREYLELWNNRQAYKKFFRRIDGIEAFKDYITPLHEYIYDNIYLGDALEIIEKINFKYDLVIVIDVLEHFNKNSGKLLIEKIFKKSNGLLISTPKIFALQKDSFNNIYEIHRSSWSKKALERIGPHIFIYDKYNHIYLFDKQETLNNLKEKLVNSYVEDLYNLLRDFIINPLRTIRYFLSFIIKNLYKIFIKS